MDRSPPSKDNDQMVDHLIHFGNIRSSTAQRVFRVVDRGDYYAADDRINAYKDAAYRKEKLHLSAPSVYAVALEALQLKPGLSFLNLGSGSGYFSTIAGVILGQYGINHGIEYYDENVQYAEEKLKEFIRTSKVVDEYDFCEPVFTCGNCLTMDDNSQKYDRVYCGAACPPEYEQNIKNLIKVNGILVLPKRHALWAIKRVDETTWSFKKILNVNYSPLIQPNVINAGEEPCVELTVFAPLKLQELCRFCVRSELRKTIICEHPALINKDYRLNMMYTQYSDIKDDLCSDEESEDGNKSLNISGLSNAEFLREIKDRMLLKKQGKRSREMLSRRVASNEMTIVDQFIFSPFPIAEFKKCTDIKEEEFIAPPSLSTRGKKRKSSSLETDLESEPSCSQQYNCSSSKPKLIQNSVKVNLEEKVIKEFSFSYFLTEKIEKLPIPFKLSLYINYDRNNFFHHNNM